MQNGFKKVKHFVVVMLSMIIMSASTGCYAGYSVQYTSGIRTTYTIEYVRINGTPIMVEGNIFGYYLNGLYYYPYLYDGVWWMRCYARPITISSWAHRPIFKPYPNDVRGHRHVQPPRVQPPNRPTPRVTPPPPPSKGNPRVTLPRQSQQPNRRPTISSPSRGNGRR